MVCNWDKFLVMLIGVGVVFDFYFGEVMCVLGWM